MRIERLELTNFRSYRKQVFKFGQMNVLLGPNGVGKTNVLEAINLLVTGNSIRARVTEEMITWGEEIANVTGIVEESDGEYVSLSSILTPGKYLGKRTSKKRYLVDGAGRSKATFVGRVVAVMFRPEDLRLIEGSPGRRRQFLDEILVQSDPNYGRSLTAYERALRRRNRLLRMIREGEATRQQLSFWDQAIIKNGNIITDVRREYLEYLSGVETSYGKYEVEYQYSSVSEARLTQYEREEVAAGYTLVGPHKDDFAVSMKQESDEKALMNLHTYGSRGEQRLGVLYLKMASMEYLEKRLKVRPILLLDDVFSELDDKHRSEVVKMMGGRQVIITTAKEEVLDIIKGLGSDGESMRVMRLGDV